MTDDKVVIGGKAKLRNVIKGNTSLRNVLNGSPGVTLGGGMSPAVKEALLDCFEHVAWIDDDGQDYYQALYDALYPKVLASITAVFNQGQNVIYDTDTLDDLTQYLTVTATYDDSSTATIASTDYTLSGTLTPGTSTITVTYKSKTATFNVTVTHMPGTVTITNTLTGCTTSNAAASGTEGASYSATITASSGYSLTGASVSITMGGVDITSSAYTNGTISIAEVTGALVITITAVAVTLVSISAVYTQSGTVYTTDSLDSLKTDLVVTALYSDTSTETVPSADYTLSGTLTAGTSTITVTYEGKTTTFNVTVTSWKNKMSYVFTHGDLVKTNYSVGYDETHGAYLGVPNPDNRRSFVIPYGDRSFRFTADNVTWDETSDYYPIPVPSNATEITLSITPSSQYFGISMLTLADNEYTRVLNPGWKQGSWTTTFTAGEYDYMTINCKMNSSGTKYTTEPTEFTITFE